MLKLTRVLGSAADAAFSDRLHHLAHHGAVEYITLSEEETARRHFRATTDRGTDCAIVLSRTDRLENGAVLLLEPNRAVVVRLAAPRFLRLRPRDAAAALELGYFAGNMHWKVVFGGGVLSIQLDGAEAEYLSRAEPLVASGRVQVVHDEESSAQSA
jgi:urease accessory protein